jgi:hypothetical protein
MTDNKPYTTSVNDINYVYVDENTFIPRIIVCAANRIDGLIICGARHHDSIMNAVYKKLKLNSIANYKKEEQGFIDQYGQFVTREDAAFIVKANKQHLRDDKIVDWLFSENLY